MAVANAMKREGPGAVPIVAHRGEEVLTTRNGDAPFQRDLRRSGVWSRLKANYNQLKKPETWQKLLSDVPMRNDSVPNFAFGGSVGGGGSFSFTPRPQTRSSGRGDTIIHMNIQTNDADSFRKTKDQINAEQRRQIDQSKRND
jgi:hypothetical protein